MSTKQLTQAEIDALINQVGAGERKVDEKKQPEAKKYDFRSPKKFTKEQLKTLDSLNENFARLLSSYLSGILRVYSEISVLSIEEQRYFEYNNALPDSVLIGSINFKPEDRHYSEGMMLMDITKSMGYFFVDRLLGGTGEGNDLTRDYTEIELGILDNVLGKILSKLQESWSNYIDIDFKLSSIETNARLLQTFAPEDVVVLIMFNMKVGDLTGMMNICIPAENLEEIIGNFSVRYTRSSKRQLIDDAELRRQLIFDELMDGDLEIKAILDEQEILLSDILQLQVNDVIPLGRNINSDIFITIDGDPWYTAKLGEVKTKKAVRLNEPIKE